MNVKVMFHNYFKMKTMRTLTLIKNSHELASVLTDNKPK